MSTTRHRFPGGKYGGWRRQQPDRRDYRYHPPQAVLANLPPAVDLSANLGPVVDQGQLGSCGPNMADGNIMYDRRKQGLADVSSVSRLFIYYNTRILMGTVGQDSGVDNRSMMKALAQYGFCNETLWPYVISQFTVKPPQPAYDAAAPNRISNYAAVTQTLDEMRGTLAAGYCIWFGFTVYESFESAEASRTGTIPMPGPNEDVLGGHDILFYGYDDASQRFRARNSWGVGWGAGGNLTMPYAYATDPNLSGDFWTVNSLPGVTPVTTPSRLQLTVNLGKGTTQLYDASRRSLGAVRSGPDHGTPKGIYNLTAPTGIQSPLEGTMQAPMRGTLRDWLPWLLAQLESEASIAVIRAAINASPLPQWEKSLLLLILDRYTPAGQPGAAILAPLLHRSKGAA